MIYSYQVFHYEPISYTLLPIWLLILITHIAFGFISLLELGSILWPLIVSIYVSFAYTVIGGVVVSSFANSTFNIVMGIVVILVHEIIYCFINFRIRLQSQKLIKRQKLLDSLNRLSSVVIFKDISPSQSDQFASGRYLNSSLNEDDVIKLSENLTINVIRQYKIKRLQRLYNKRDCDSIYNQGQSVKNSVEERSEHFEDIEEKLMTHQNQDYLLSEKLISNARPFTSTMKRMNHSSWTTEQQSKHQNGKTTTVNGYSIRTDSELDDKILTDEIVIENNQSPDFKFFMFNQNFNQEQGQV
ncbi:UNKNOWN [Stylonychia lemnae]|uniref:Transmembrane protein n=1 Tax=Stylonychia lemnae TaxID=5949 RepID=A0A078B3X8_STYLE|nr:UNKNOWN [Stylonychia lemnae]|eukprot:CDW89199.1 UNKNOWN [Stylonychia lemnae]